MADNLARQLDIAQYVRTLALVQPDHAPTNDEPECDLDDDTSPTCCARAMEPQTRTVGATRDYPGDAVAVWVCEACGETSTRDDNE